MDTLRQDLRGSLRYFRRHRGFVTAAVFVLALGIGATTAVFSVSDGARSHRLSGLQVTPEFFAVFGVPLDGRAFVAGDRGAGTGLPGGRLPSGPPVSPAPVGR